MIVVGIIAACIVIAIIVFIFKAPKIAESAAPIVSDVMDARKVIGGGMSYKNLLILTVSLSVIFVIIILWTVCTIMYYIK